MEMNNITYALSMMFRESFRNRITVLLLLLIPATFYIIGIYTLNDIPMLVRIASAPAEPIILVKPKDLGLIYIGLAANGFLASFMALNIMQRNVSATKRLILCGYKTMEISLARFILVICIVTVIGIYTAVLGLFLFHPKHIPGVIAGYILCGYVYGSFGLLTGAVLKRELEGILVIVLMANLDIGWLQNPIFYAAAPNKLIIKLLPGFNPSQAGIISAFTDYPAGSAILHSILYGTLFLIMAMIVFRIKMNTNVNILKNKY